MVCDGAEWGRQMAWGLKGCRVWLKELATDAILIEEGGIKILFL